jgi:hypothetical protein
VRALCVRVGGAAPISASRRHLADPFPNANATAEMTSRTHASEAPLPSAMLAATGAPYETMSARPDEPAPLPPMGDSQA